MAKTTKTAPKKRSTVKKVSKANPKKKTAAEGKELTLVPDLKQIRDSATKSAVKKAKGFKFYNEVVPEALDQHAPRAAEAMRACLAKPKKHGRPEKWDEPTSLALASHLIEWMNEKPSNIYYEEFLMLNNVYSDVTNQLAKKFDSFSRLIKMAKKIQEQKLVMYLTTGNLNTAGTIFVLKNKHGWTDKREVAIEDNRSSFEENLEAVLLKRQAAAGKQKKMPPRKI